MKRVITYGTFDVLHYGHINLLRRAKSLGDYLIVGLSSDEFNLLKNKKSFYTYEERKKILEGIRFVDLVIPENNWEQKPSDIQGLIYIPFQNKVDEVAINLIRELSTQGINIDSGRI